MSPRLPHLRVLGARRKPLFLSFLEVGASRRHPKHFNNSWRRLRRRLLSNVRLKYTSRAEIAASESSSQNFVFPRILGIEECRSLASSLPQKRLTAHFDRLFLAAARPAPYFYGPLRGPFLVFWPLRGPFIVSGRCAAHLGRFAAHSLFLAASRPIHCLADPPPHRGGRVKTSASVYNNEWTPYAPRVAFWTKIELVQTRRNTMSLY